MKASYALSLPERSLRAASALGGGLLRELCELSLPPGVRDSTLYRATAGIALRFLTEQVGDVRGAYPPNDPIARKFVIRYATGGSIELLSIVHFYVSPVWVLAALGDVTRVGKTIFRQIGDALKAEGLLAPDATYDTMLELMDGLERTSTHLAMTVNMPPLDARGLRSEWLQLRANIALLPRVQLPSAADVERTWSKLQEIAAGVGQPVFRVSEAVGAATWKRFSPRLDRLSRSAVVAGRTTGMVVGKAFLDHYDVAFREMSRIGFSDYWATHSRPYLVAAIRNFLPRRRSWTERLLA